MTKVKKVWKKMSSRAPIAIGGEIPKLIALILQGFTLSERVKGLSFEGRT